MAQLNSCQTFFVLSALFLTSCSSSPPYETTTSNYIHTFARGGSRVAILLFSADPKLSQIGSGGPLQALRQKAQDPSSAEKTDIPATIVKLRVAEYVSALSSKYHVVGTTQPTVIKTPHTTDRQWIIDAIKSASADYGIVVRDQYGVDWGDSTLETLVDGYIFRVSTSVFAPDGTLVWRFATRGRAEEPSKWFPKPLSATNAADILSRFIKYYPRLEESLIEDDVAGRPHLGEGSQGLGKYLGKTEKEIALFVVNDNDTTYGNVFPTSS